MQAAGADNDDGMDDAPDLDDNDEDPKPTLRVKLEKASDEQRLAVDYFDKSVCVYDFISYKNLETDDVPIKCIQVLNKHQKCIHVHTYNSADLTDQMALWGVQPYDIWNGHVLQSDAERFQAFKSGDPEDIDLLSCIGDIIDGRSGICTWRIQKSDTAGCEEWFSPSVVKYDKSLMTVDAPVLAIVDQLRENHFTAKYSKIDHRRRSGKFYDARSLPSKRSYLQCLLVQAQLFEKGVVEFSSGNSDAFYKLLMRSPAKAVVGMTSRQCKLALQNVDSALVPLYTPALQQRALGVDVDSGDEDTTTGAIVRGRAKRAAKAAPLPLEDEAKHIDGDSGGKSSSSSASSSDTWNTSASNKCSVDGDSGSRSSSSASSSAKFPRSVEGARLKHEIHKSKNSEGLRVTCGKHGMQCRRFRALNVDVATFGDQAPVFYLGCWLSHSGDMTIEEHRKFFPTLGDVRKYLEK